MHFSHYHDRLNFLEYLLAFVMHQRHFRGLSIYSSGLKNVKVYLDDIIIANKSIEDHVNDHKDVFEMLL